MTSESRIHTVVLAYDTDISAQNDGIEESENAVFNQAPIK